MEFNRIQKMILKPMLMGQAAYILGFVLVLTAWRFDLFTFSWPWVFLIMLGNYLTFAAFLVMVLKGWNASFRDPSMTLAQILANLMTQLPLLFFFAPEIRGVMLFTYSFPLMFAMLKLNWRQGFFLTLYPICFYGFLCWFLWQFQPDRIQVKVELVRFAVFSGACFWLAYFSGYINRLRSRLKQQGHELKESNDRLLAMQKQLVNAAHRAGMAEVAAEVLHNVGHTLNSMSVSTEVIEEALKPIKISLFRRLAQLLHDNREDLPAFFRTDPRAHKLPVALHKLANTLEKTQTHSLDELTQLRRSIEDLRFILNEHNSYTGDDKLNQIVEINGLVAEVLAEEDHALERGEIRVELALSPLPEALVQRAKLASVLSHLIQNARESMDYPHKTKERTLTIRTQREGAFARVDVEDTGIGLPKSNQDRIFTYGYTTKSRAQGNGLHYSANAMIEMGGRIEAVNRSERQGARFSLWLPLAD